MLTDSWEEEWSWSHCYFLLQSDPWSFIWISGIWLWPISLFLFLVSCFFFFCLKKEKEKKRKREIYDYNLYLSSSLSFLLAYVVSFLFDVIFLVIAFFFLGPLVWVVLKSFSILGQWEFQVMPFWCRLVCMELNYRTSKERIFLCVYFIVFFIFYSTMGIPTHARPPLTHPCP